MIVTRGFIRDLKEDARVVNCYPEEVGDFIILYSDGSAYVNSRSEKMNKIRNINKQANEMGNIFSIIGNSNEVKENLKNIKNVCGVMDAFNGNEFNVCTFMPNGEYCVDRIKISEFNPKKQDIYVYNRNGTCFTLIKKTEKNIDKLIEIGDLRKIALKYIGGTNIIDEYGMRSKTINMSDENIYMVSNGEVKKLGKIDRDSLEELIKIPRIYDEYMRKDKKGHILLVNFTQNDSDDETLGNNVNISFMWFNSDGVEKNAPMNPDDPKYGDTMIFRTLEEASEFNKNGSYREYILGLNTVKESEKIKRNEERKNRFLDLFEGEIGKVITGGIVTTAVTGIGAGVVKLIKDYIERRKDKSSAFIIKEQLVDSVKDAFKIGSLRLPKISKAFLPNILAFSGGALTVMSLLNKLLPGLGEFIKELPIIREIWDFLTRNFRKLAESDTIIGKIIRGFGFVINCVRDFFTGIIEKGKEIICNVVTTVIEGIKTVGEAIGNFFGSIFSFSF